MTFAVNAQDKKFQVGLMLGSTFDWIKTQTTEIERNGIGGGFTIGMAGNYMFNENIGLASGIQFDLGSYTINYGRGVSGSSPSGRVYYAYKDTDIKKYKDGVVEDFSAPDTSALELQSRKYKTKYVTLPVFLKFQTNKIGQFIYYGKFGLRTSFLAGVRMDDSGLMSSFDHTTGDFTSGTQTLDLVDMKPVTSIFKRGASFLKMGIGIYGGAEWNFTGNTHLFMEGGFNYGIVPGMVINSGHLVNQVDDGSGTDGLYGNGVLSRDNLDIKNNPQHLIEIKVGLLF